MTSRVVSSVAPAIHFTKMLQQCAALRISDDGRVSAAVGGRARFAVQNRISAISRQAYTGRTDPESGNEKKKKDEDEKGTQILVQEQLCQ